MKNIKLIAITLLISLTATLSACNIKRKKDEISSIENYSSETSELSGNDEETGETVEVETPPETVIPVVMQKENKTTYIRCLSSSVNIRSAPNTSSTVYGTAEKDTSYVLLGEENGWYKTYYRGKTAYVHGKYFEKFTLKNNGNDKIEKVLFEAYKLLGTPYVYGATRYIDEKGNRLKGFTENAFDCSSLVQYVFYKGANKILPLTTRTQYVKGEYVAKADLTRGDCIYFTNASRQYNTGVERIGHVAIYLGDGYILHTASDYARIEKLSSVRMSYYVVARRFI